MRAFYITLFLAVLSTSLALKTTSQQKSLDIRGFKFNAESQLGAALAGLMEITQLEETQEVVDIITQVREELKALLKDAQEAYDRDETQFKSSKSQYESTLYDLTNSINDNTNALQEAQGEEARLTTSIDTSIAAINAAQDGITTENNRRSEVSHANQQKLADLSEAIAACNDAEALLEEIRAKDLAKSDQLNLLQTSERKIQNHLKNIHEKLEKMQVKGTIAPMIKMLVEVVQEGVNVEIIDQILNLLRELRASLIQEHKDTEDSDATDESYHTSTITALTHTVNTETDSVNDNSALLKGVQGIKYLFRYSFSRHHQISYRQIV
jgi:chromosome segregation ATPase